MKNSTKRFFTSLSIVTLLAPIFLASAEVFAEDFSTSESSEVITETMPETVSPLNEPILENNSPIEPTYSTSDEALESPITESSTDIWVPENTTDGIPESSSSTPSTNDGVLESSNTAPSTTDETYEGTTDSSNLFEDTSSTDIPPVIESTDDTSIPEETSSTDETEDSSNNDWTGGIGLDDLEIDQTIEETFTLSATDIIKNDQNENYVLKTKDGKIGIKIDLSYGFSSWSGFDSKENILSISAYGKVHLTDDSLGKLYSFSDYEPGSIDVHGFNSSSDKAFYLKDKKGKVTEYLLKLETENHEPFVEKAFEMSEKNSGKPFSTKDGLITITPDYKQFNWKIQANDANWKVLNGEIYSISKSYEKRTYHISIYSEKLQQVKSYEIPVERMISEDTVVDHEIDIKLSQNNQYRFANEFYQEYDDILSGLSITAYFSGWGYHIEMNQKNDYYMESLSYDNNETDAKYISYVEHRTWTDGFYDEDWNWTDPVETVTQLKLNITIDNTTEIDESKEKVFTFNLDHNQLIMNSKEDNPYEVTLNYGGPSNYSEIFRIAYLNTTDFNSSDYNYKGEYVQVGWDNSYVNSLHEDIPGTVESSTDHGNKIIFNINNSPTLDETIVNIDVSRKNDWDNPVEISPDSDELLKIRAEYGHSSYYISYDYDYNGAFYYESPDWIYDYPVMTETAEQTIYKRKDYSGKIVAIYKIKFNFEKLKVELQEPLSLNIPKKIGFNRVYQETPDGLAVLAGYSNMDYEVNNVYFSTYAVATKKGLENNAQIHYEGFSTYPGDEDSERDPFLYVEAKDGIIKKYPVTVIPDVSAETPTKKEYFAFDISATSQELVQINSDIENTVPGKIFDLSYSEYENWPATIYLDRDNYYRAHNEDTPTDERFVLFFQGVLPFEKTGTDQYQATIDWHPYFKYNLTITDNQVTDILPTKLSLSESKVKVKTDETATIKATVTPENATNKSITWTSKDKTIATVTNGVITGVKAGKTTITAETVNGLKKSVEVTVTKAPEKPVDREELPDQSGTGVSVSAPKGVLPKGAELKVEPIKESNNVHQKLDELTDGKFMLFDIKLHNTEAGQNVQPNGTVQVRIPIPTGFDPAKIRMYRFDEFTGKRTALNGWVDGAYYVFETDQFSYYALVEEEPTVSKEVLNELIAKAKDLQAASYTVESWNLFAEKLRAAHAIAGNQSASDFDVKQAIDELTTAMDNLVKKTTTKPDAGDNNQTAPETDKESTDNTESNNSSNNNTSKPNKPSTPEIKPSEKVETTPKTKKDDALPQLGSSASVLLPALGLLLMGFSSFVFLRRNRLN